MKYLLLALMGLIHLMGFAKAFDLASLDELRRPVPQPVGLLWLAAAVLFLAAAVCLVVAPAWWWVPAGATERTARPQFGGCGNRGPRRRRRPRAAGSAARCAGGHAC